MPGMLAGSVRERRKFFNKAFIGGWETYNETNDAADQIVDAPDKFLLSQDELFEAEGGWTTFGLTAGLAGLGATAMLMGRPGMAAHFGRGQLKAMEWGMLGAATFAGGFVGREAGIQMCGDASRTQNHWMAYTFVKTQNRYIGGSILGSAPQY